MPLPLRVTASAAAVLSAVLLLSGCGSGVSAERAGAAAVVDGESVPVAEVQRRAGALRAALGGRAAQAGTPNLARYALNDLLGARIEERALLAAGASPSAERAAELRARDRSVVGSEDALREQLLLRYGVVPSRIDDFYLRQAGLAALGGGSGDRRVEVDRALQEAAASMSITVNPRYGEWDARGAGLKDTDQPWLREREA